MLVVLALLVAGVMVNAERGSSIRRRRRIVADG